MVRLKNMDWQAILKNPITWIMTGAAVYRFVLLPDLPFTHDEYSSMIRMQGSYGAMLANGVITDSHPAGLYTYLRVFTSIFGNEPWIVKLPFILMNLWSIWLAYSIGRRWFNKTSGQVAAFFLAFALFPVLHGSIARMYVPGFLGALLAAHFWTRLVLEADRNKWKNALGMGLAFVLCAYFHYFAALFCVTLWVGGLFFVRKELLLKYVAAPSIATILFLPHMAITLDQLSRGGIPTVLPKPGLDFVSHHLAYIFDFSVLLMIGVGLIFLVNLWHRPWQNKLWLFSLGLFLAPIIVGLVYSNLNEPVLQDRVLLFTLPFGLFLIASKAQPREGKWRWDLGIFVVFFLLLSAYGHSELTRGEHRDMVHLSKSSSAKEIPSLMAYKSEILEFEIERQDAVSEFITNPDSTWTIADFRRFVSEAPPEGANFGWTTQYYIPPSEIIALLHDKYDLNKKVQWSHGEWFEFRKEGHGDYQPQTITTWQEEGWVPRSEGREAFDSTRVYGPTFVMPLPEIAFDINDRLFVTVKGRWDNATAAQIVVQLSDEDGVVYWNSRALSEFHSDRDTLQIAHCAMPVYGATSDFDVDFKTFIWNSKGDNFELESMEIWSDGGNPIMYCLDHPVPSRPLSASALKQLLE